MFTLLFLLYSLTFAVHADGGSFIDPIGYRLTAHSDEGPGLCPVGGRRAGASSDSGVRIDPEG